MPQQKSKKILIYIFLFLIIGTMNNKNLNSENYPKINKIIVTGLDIENNLRLVKSLNFLKFSNLFFINKIQITEIIDSNNSIEQYSIFKKYPSSLEIKISKAKFLANVEKNGNNFFLGSNGKLIKTKYQKVNIPHISGNFKNKDFFELKKIINETNFNYNEIEILFFFESGRWDIKTYSGILIRLPKDIKKKYLQLSFDIMSKDKLNKISEIDFRQLNQIIINEK
jgi:cell division septal protein FtsQ